MPARLASKACAPSLDAFCCGFDRLDGLFSTVLSSNSEADCGAGVDVAFFLCSAAGVDAAVVATEEACDLPEKKDEKKEDGLVIEVAAEGDGDGLAVRAIFADWTFFCNNESSEALELNADCCALGEGVPFAEVGDSHCSAAVTGEASLSIPSDSLVSGSPSSSSAIMPKLLFEILPLIGLPLAMSPSTSLLMSALIVTWPSANSGSAAEALIYIVLTRGAGADIDMFDLRCRAVRNK